MTRIRLCNHADLKFDPRPFVPALQQIVIGMVTTSYILLADCSVRTSLFSEKVKKKKSLAEKHLGHEKKTEVFYLPEVQEVGAVRHFWPRNNTAHFSVLNLSTA